MSVFKPGDYVVHTEDYINRHGAPRRGYKVLGQPAQFGFVTIADLVSSEVFVHNEISLRLANFRDNVLVSDEATEESLREKGLLDAYNRAHDIIADQERMRQRLINSDKMGSW